MRTRENKTRDATNLVILKIRNMLISRRTFNVNAGSV